MHFFIEILSRDSLHLCLDNLVLWLVGFIRQKVCIKLEDCGPNGLSLCSCCFPNTLHLIKSCFGHYYCRMRGVLVLLLLVVLLGCRVGIFCDVQVNLQVFDCIGSFLELCIKAHLLDDMEHAMYMNEKVLGVTECPDGHLHLDANSQKYQHEVVGLGFGLKGILDWILLWKVAYRGVLTPMPCSHSTLLSPSGTSLIVVMIDKITPNWVP